MNIKTIISVLKYLFVVVGVVIMVGPFYWMVSGSFKTLVEAQLTPPTLFPHQPTLKTYIDIFTLIPFHRFLLNSFYVCTVTVSLKIFSSMLAGYIFAKFAFRGKNLLFYLLLLGLMVPFQMFIIPLYILVVKFGWSDTLTALIVPGYFEILALFLARQYMHSIPDDLLDSARIDGASEFAIFFRIVFPLCSALAIPLFILLYLQKWNVLLWPLIVLSTKTKFTLSLGLALLVQGEFQDLLIESAGATIAMLPILVLFVIMQNKIREGIVLTGMK